MRRRVAVVLLALACAACGGGDEQPPATAEPEVLPSNAYAHELGGESCAPCHQDEVARWRASAHRLASRPADDPFQRAHAKLAADAPILDAGREAASFDDSGAMRAPDATGATEARALTHVLGGRRREDFLSMRPDGPHVLPLSWSVTRGAWTDSTAEERGAAIDPKGPLGWTQRARSHSIACSRCHPVREEGPGITCETCHPDAEKHRNAPMGEVAGNTARKAGIATDTWKSCGPCHAAGFDMPGVARASAAGPLLDALLPDTLVLTEGFNPAFAIDGRPIVAHGREAQSLAQSRCFLEGGATCVTCHDPHGGERTSLREPDPDASCRTCHAAIAADAAAHARHPVAPSVPLAIDEPGGPWIEMTPAGPSKTARLPGCVDCHAPALLGFSPADTIRDHAIGIPDPVTAQGLRTAHACAACHPSKGEKWLAKALPATPPARRARAKTFATAARAMFAGGNASDQRDALAGSLAMLADGTVDPWTRASAASLVGVFGRPAMKAAPGRTDLAAALEAAWGASGDPVLRRAIAAAHPHAGGTADALAALVATEADWRVRAAAAASLSSLSDPRGADMLEAIRRDLTLPPRARAEAAFELGSALVRRGSNERGEALLLESLGNWNDNAGAWVNLGAARASKGDVAGAREAWQRALELSPGNPMAKANLDALETSAEDAKP